MLDRIRYNSEPISVYQGNQDPVHNSHWPGSPISPVRDRGRPVPLANAVSSINNDGVRFSRGSQIPAGDVDLALSGVDKNVTRSKTFKNC